MSNNPTLWDAIVSGGASSSGAWPTSEVPGDYAAEQAALVALATEIDAAIPTISSGATLSQMMLLNGIVSRVFGGRALSSIDPNTYAAVAASIAAQFQEVSPILQNPFVPVVIPAPFVYYLNSSADPVIPNYYQLTPAGSYVAGSQATATAVGTPSATVQFSVGGQPAAWISQSPVGEPFVQEGEWVTDLWASVNQPVSTTNIRLSVYVRTVGGTETHLFDVTGPRCTLSTAQAVSGEGTENQYACNTTDRLVVKAFAVFSGTTVATTATLYYQGNANASHVHTPIVPGPVVS